jgi:hypothetical protein
MANVNVQFSASIKDLVEATNNVKDAIDSVAETAKNATATMQRFGELAGVGLSIDGIKRFVESEAKLGEQTENIMGQLGLSAEQVGVLGGMAQISGTDIESLALSFERMSLNVQKSLSDAFSPAAQGLKVLHLNARELIGLPADEYWRRLAQAVARFNPSLNLTNALTAVAGRGVAQMIETLRRAGESWDEWQEAIKATGATLSDAQARAFAKTNIGIELLKLNVEGLGNAMFSQLEPAIDAVVKQMTGFIAEIRDSIREGGAWSYVLAGLGDTLKIIATAFAGVAAMIRFLSVEAKAFWDTTAENGEAVGKQLKADLNKISSDFKNTWNSLWGLPEITVHAKLKLDNAGAMNEGGRDAFQDQVKQIQERIRMQDESYKSEVEEINAAAKLQQLTEQEKTAALIAAVRTRVGQVQSEIQQEIDLYKSVGKNVSALELQKVQAAKQGADDIKKINSQAAEEYTKEWTSALTAVQSAFDSQLKGLLSGTESWATAMQKTVGNLIMELIKGFERLAIDKAAAGLADITGTGPISAISGLFGALGGGGQAAALQASFTTGAATLTTSLAGAFAAGATTVGAAITAAFAAGNTESASLKLVPFATGAWEIPSITPAVLHPGEMVVPAGIADTLRAGLSGAGRREPELPNFMRSTSDNRSVNVNFTHNGGGLNPADIEKHARTIAKAVANHWQINPSIRPRY